MRSGHVRRKKGGVAKQRKRQRLIVPKRNAYAKWSKRDDSRMRRNRRVKQRKRPRRRREKSQSLMCSSFRNRYFCRRNEHVRSLSYLEEDEISHGVRF